jgi:hypothetical protein
MNQETLNIAYFIAAILISLLISHRLFMTIKDNTARRARRRLRNLESDVEQLRDDVFELFKKVFPERFKDPNETDESL